MLTIAGILVSDGRGTAPVFTATKQIKREYSSSNSVLEICRYFAQILESTMNQQEIRSKYYLHSDVFHPESTTFFFFFSKNDILVLW